MPRSAAFIALVCATQALAAYLTVQVGSSAALVNPSALPPSTHAVLLGPPGVRHDVALRKDNTFVFPDLDPASYLLNIHSRDHIFHPIRIDVTAGGVGEGEEENRIAAWQTFPGNEWNNKGRSFGNGTDQLTIQVLAATQKQFYQPRVGFSILSFLKSPMILMALFSGALIFGMPWMLENMDEETRAELEEMQKKGVMSGQNGAATKMQNFDLAGWMAGKGSGSSSEPADTT